MTGIKSFRISDETKERLELLSASIGGNNDRVFNTLYIGQISGTV